MTQFGSARIEEIVYRFIDWIDAYGETSFDHQTFYASPVGRKAKELYYRAPILGTAAVAPFVFCEAFFPSARKLFWKRQRLPISDAHYAMGFALLYSISGKREHLGKAYHLLGVLERTRCEGYERFCWGYPFDWVTRNGVVPAGTPLITITPYAYEAFLQVYEIDRDPRWLGILRSIADHAAEDIKDFDFGPGACTCSYTPFDKGGVINASAYRSFLLMNASLLFKSDRYKSIARKNVEFVLQSQQPSGAWPYAVDGVREFIDHFHTCFVLKGLAKVEKHLGSSMVSEAIEKGVDYYVNNLFDGIGVPKPFSRAPRLTVYRQELYDYAECINLGVLLKGRFPKLDRVVRNVLEDVSSRWQKGDGSFRSRKLLFGWDNVPMHRWGQAQMFRSLCFFLAQEISIKSEQAG